MGRLHVIEAHGLITTHVHAIVVIHTPIVMVLRRCADNRKEHYQPRNNNIFLIHRTRPFLDLGPFTFEGAIGPPAVSKRTVVRASRSLAWPPGSVRVRRTSQSWSITWRSPRSVSSSAIRFSRSVSFACSSALTSRQGAFPLSRSLSTRPNSSTVNPTASARRTKRTRSRVSGGYRWYPLGDRPGRANNPLRS